MKFKATVKDPRVLASLCNAVKAFQKRCVLKLHRDRLRFIAAPTGPADGSQVWAAVATDTVLSNLKLESRAEDTIYLEVTDIAQLGFAAKAAERSHGAVLRLTKADTRQLLTMSWLSANSTADTTHEVDVHVMTQEEIDGIAAPPLRSDVVQMALPSLAELAAVVDRFKVAGSTAVTFAVGPEAAPSLLVHTETTTAAFRVELKSADLIARPEDEGAVQATVDLKRLCRIFGAKEASPHRVVLHVVDQAAVVLSCHGAGDSTVVSYLPALATNVM